MTSPRLVAAGVTLRAQVDERWPGRDKRSDGWIGDAAHAARKSDHNPDADGWVHALDIDKDGIDAQALAEQLAAYAAEEHRAGRRRILNIVWNDQVASGTYANHFWTFRGSGYGHLEHIHVSFTDAAELDGGPFPLAVFDQVRTCRVTKWPRTGIYERKDEKSPRRAWKLRSLFRDNVQYVDVEHDPRGRLWLRMKAGGWMLAAATSYKEK